MAAVPLSHTSGLPCPAILLIWAGPQLFSPSCSVPESFSLSLSLHPCRAAWPLQEQAFLAAAVERIASFSPDVVVVERSVARYAQELLLDRGVALVLNVKRDLLERIARCTDAEVRRWGGGREEGG